MRSFTTFSGVLGLVLLASGADTRSCIRRDAATSIVNTTRYVFAFGASYTTEGFSGNGSPLDNYTKSCTSVGPNWARQVTTLLGNETQLIDTAVSGAAANRSIVPSGVIDFREQVDVFDTYVRDSPSLSWNGSNSLVVINFGTNDVNNVYRLNTTDQPNGTEVHNRDQISYFNAVERLYVSGLRSFVFTGVLPFDRAHSGIDVGPELQARLKAHIIDWEDQLAAKSDAWCKSKSDLGACFFFDTRALGTEILDNFEDYGFISDSAFCSAYASSGSCTVNTTTAEGCAGPASSYFWKDSLHPTWAVDKYWAEGIYNKLTAA